MSWVNFVKVSLIMLKGSDTRAVRPLSHITHTNWSPYFTSHRFNLHTLWPMEHVVCLRLKKGVGVTRLVLLTVEQERAYGICNTSQHCVNLQIMCWNWRNLLKRLPVKYYDK